MEFLFFLLIIHTLMLPIGIVFLIMGALNKDEAEKASYYSIGKKFLITYFIILGLIILVGFGLCYVYFKEYG